MSPSPFSLHFFKLDRKTPARLAPGSPSLSACNVPLCLRGLTLRRSSCAAALGTLPTQDSQDRANTADRMYTSATARRFLAVGTKTFLLSTGMLLLLLSVPARSAAQSTDS